MSFPVTPVLDNFNRADENPLSGGGNWVHSSLWWGGADLKLASNVVTQNAGGSASTWVPQTFAVPVEIHVEKPTQHSNAAHFEDLETLLQRGDVTDAPDGYVYEAIVGDGMWIYRLDAGVYTEIADDTSVVLSSGDAFGARQVGSTLSMWKRVSSVWSQVLSTTDVTYSGPYYLSLGRNGDGTHDNFGGGEMRVRDIIGGGMMIPFAR